MNEVIAMLEDENFLEASVYLAPPGDGLESDEVSDVEEGSSANHVSSCQLTASAEYVINYGSEKVNSLENDDKQQSRWSGRHGGDRRIFE